MRRPLDVSVCLEAISATKWANILSMSKWQRPMTNPIPGLKPIWKPVYRNLLVGGLARSLIRIGGKRPHHSCCRDCNGLVVEYTPGLWNAIGQQTN
jgi:hypothetical protein